MSGVMCTWRRPRAADVGLARALVDQVLVAAEIGESGRGVARLAVSEAFTNALVHGQPEVGVEVWARSGHCGVIEVYDAEPALPYFPESGELVGLLSEHGRGLALIQAFTRQVCGVYRCGQGKRVWFAVDCDGAELNAAEVRGLVEGRARRRLSVPTMPVI